MRDRTFGVEIECGVDVGRNAPVCICLWDEEAQEWYPPEDEHCGACCGCGEGDDGSEGCEFAAQLLHDNGFRDWTDGIHQDGSGVEIPSPVLQGVEGLNELREVMALLVRNGFYTTQSDGLHVHHGAEDFIGNEPLSVRLIELWEENLPQIHKLVNASRRDNGYCGSRMDQPGWVQFKQDKKLDSLGHSRFYGLALRHETVEFRLHQGTLDFDKAAAWIHFGQEFLELAKRKATVVTCASAIDLLRTTGTSSKSTRTLLVKAEA